MIKSNFFRFSAILVFGAVMTMMSSCSDDELTNGSGVIDPNVDYLQTKVTADVPTAVLSSFDDNSMGGALVRRLSNTTNGITDGTKMVLIKGEDVASRPITEWFEMAKIYLRGGYIAVEKPHNAHLVNVLEQLSANFTQAEDELLLKDGVSIVRPAGGNTRALSSHVNSFKTRIANIETRAGESAGTKEPVAEMVIFSTNGYYHCAPSNSMNIITTSRDKSGNVSTKTESVSHDYTPYEMGLQADGAAQWLNKRDEAQQVRSAGNRANGGDAINELMSADEEMTYNGPLYAVAADDEFEKRSRPNALSEIIRVWGVHNTETNKDYYFVDHKIVASVGGKVEGEYSSYKSLYRGPYEQNKWTEFGTAAYGSWFGGGDYTMNLMGKGAIHLEDAQPSTDNNTTSTSIAVGESHSQTNTIGGSFSLGFVGGKPSGSIGGNYSHGWTNGTSFTMTTSTSVKELKVTKNTDGKKVGWTYECGTDMMAGGDDEHPLAPDALVGDVDIENQACWSVSDPEGSYNVDIDQQIRMSTLTTDHWGKHINDAAQEFTLSYTLLTPNRSQQIWNMDVTFPEITTDGYNEVKPKLTEALKNQFPSVYQPELRLADKTTESETTIKQVVAASQKLLMDENALQTLREYALTYKISQFTIKWYCAGTDHNTYQLTIKAQGDPDPGKEEAQRDPVDLSKLTGDYVAQDGDVLTGTLAGNYKITIVNGAIVTLNNVTINGTNDEAYNWAGITCQGNNIIVLADGSKNVIKGFNSKMPGIHVPQGSRLIIQGTTGTLDVSSNGNGCGIGGGSETNAGDIEIQGGVITATGGEGCAGIGAGGNLYIELDPVTSFGVYCGNILISGGTVTAQGGEDAAGIGSGAGRSVCGTITIKGGTVTGYGSIGDDPRGAGIGTGGGSHTKVGDILISGGTITATSNGHYCSAIGCGGDGQCSSITIKKTVTSVTVNGSIGENDEGDCGPVIIEEGANVVQK